MTDDLSAWLDGRLQEAPPSLAAVIRRSLAPLHPCTLAHLHLVSERLMQEARSTAHARSGALTLLAADALTTLYHERLPSPVSRD